MLMHGRGERGRARARGTRGRARGRSRGRGQRRQLGSAGDNSDSDTDTVPVVADFCPVVAPDFAMRPGAQVQHPLEAGALEYFDIFFTDQVWQHMVDETNRSAAHPHHPRPTMATSHGSCYEGLRWPDFCHGYTTSAEPSQLLAEDQVAL